MAVGVVGHAGRLTQPSAISHQPWHRSRYPRTLTVIGSESLTVSAVPLGTCTSLPRVERTTAVPAPPPVAAPIAAPFLPPRRPPMIAPPAAGAPISSASFFFVAGATRLIAVVLI